MKNITSRQNPAVTSYRDAARRRTRAGPALLDGPHLLDEALRAGVEVTSVACTKRALETAEVAGAVERARAAGAEILLVTDEVLDAMSPAATPAGVVALAARRLSSTQDVFGSAAPLVVVAVDVQDPGNMGAIVRAAEAGGGTGVIACGECADPFGWKALRGAMGSAFRLPVAMADLEEAFAQAQRAGVAVAASVPRGGVPMYDADLVRPVALLLGSEGPGLERAVVNRADTAITIPMCPPIESLNVATAAAILVYEAARQRRGATRAPADGNR